MTNDRGSKTQNNGPTNDIMLASYRPEQPNQPFMIN